MARRRRRKINKRVVLLLGVLGAFMLAAIVVAIILRLPKDPTAYAQRAQQAHQKQNYSLAIEQWEKAIQYGQKAASAPLHEWHYLLANSQLDWITKRGNELNQTQRVGLYKQAKSNLQTALRIDPSYMDAQRMLCETIWQHETRRSRNYVDYIDEANKLLKLDPKDHLTYYRRSIAFASQIAAMGEESFQKAMVDIRKAVELKPDNVDYWSSMISLLYDRGLYDEVEQAYLRAEKANPTNPEIRVRHAGYLVRRNRKPEALKAIQDAIKVAPEKSTGNLALAQFHVGEAKYAEAMQALEAALKADETNGRVYLMMVDLYLQQRKTDDAIKVIRRGLSVIDKQAENISESTDASLAQRIRVGQVELTLRLANILLNEITKGGIEKDKRQEMLGEVKKCLDQAKAQGVAQPQVDSIAGQLAMAEEKPEEAFTLLRRAYDGMLRMNRVDVRAAAILISLYDRKGNPGESEKILDQILRVRPNSPAIWKAKARREIQLQRFGRALVAIRKVLELDKNDTEARDLRRAIEAVTSSDPTVPKGLKLNRQMVYLLLQRAADLWMDERQNEAVQFVESILQDTPKNLRVIQQLMGFYIRQGRLQEAQNLLSKAIKDNPDNEDLKFQSRLLAEKDREKQFEMRMARLEKELKNDPLALALSKANLCAMWNKDDEYLRYLREAEKLAPKSVVVIERLLSYAFRNKDWKQAEECIRKAEEADLDRVGGQTYRARLLMAKGEFESAIPVLNEVLALRPELKIAFAQLGECYLQTGELDEAKKAFEEAISRDPAFGPAVIGMARVAEKQGDMKALDQWILRARQLPSVKANAYVERHYLRIVEKEAPIEKKVSELIPKREGLFRRNPSDLVNVVRLGVLYEEVKRYGDAEKMYRYVYDNVSDKLSGARILADFYLRRNRTPEVARIFGECIDKAKTPAAKARAWVAYGDVLSVYDLSQSLTAMSEAIKVDGTYAPAYSAKAAVLGRMGRWTDAVNAMQDHIAKLPERSVAQEKRLIGYMISAGRYEPALQRLDRILSENPSDAQAMLLKGEVYAARGNINEAEKFYKSAAALNPNYALPYRALARMYRLAGNIGGALQALRKARTISDDIGTAFALARVYFQNGDFADTERICRDLVKNPDQPIKNQAYRLLLQVQMRQKNWSDMTIRIAEAQKAFPKDEVFWLIEADMWRARKDANRRLQAFNQALKIAPSSLRVTAGYLRALLDTKRYDEVETVAAKTQVPDAKRPIILAYRAAALALQNKTVQADKLFVESLKKALPKDFATIVRLIADGYGLKNAPDKLRGWVSLRPREWRLLSELSAICRESQLANSNRDYSQALSALQQALDLADTPAARAQIHYRFALMYYELGRFAKDKSVKAAYFEKTKASYNEVLKIAPESVGTLNNLAYMYSNDLGEPDKAEPYARRAVDMRPMDGNILDTYGWTLAKLGQLDRARAQLQRSVKLKPMAVNRYHLGWVLQRLRNFTEAEMQYELALGMAQDAQNAELIKLVNNALDRVRKDIRGEE